MLRESINRVKRSHAFKLDAMVVLPDHFHMLMTLPEDDQDFATRMMLIKAGFSRHMPKGEHRSSSRRSKGERGIWQRRYWEHLIRDDEDYARHVDYIHFNPVKHGHASRAVDWPHSTIHDYIRQDVLPVNWAGGEDDGETSFGESN